MNRVGLLQVTGYEWKPGDRTFLLSGIAYQPARFPCEPGKILERALGSYSLGDAVLLPMCEKIGKLVPILGSTTSSASIITEIKLFRGSKENIGYQELDPLKGLLVPIYRAKTFDCSTYERFSKESQPYLKKLEDTTESIQCVLDRF